ncbi:MAG: UDP-GlcNAc3NAcA epimerase [Salibacteraceae bacterium]|jgi:UDP-GlcNAc3NAcA epimerase
MKIVTIIGARPQFIKASSLSREIAKYDSIEEVIVHTGQHFDKNMSEIFFEEMNIPKPKYNLEINSLSHGAMTGRMMEAIEEVLVNERPDWVVVYGDTNSTIAGALTAKKMHIKVAHIEAGLRSFDMRMPEEINRILTDQISDVLFCPTDVAIANLKNEGFDKKNIDIIECGDIMYDSALFYKSLMHEPKNYDLPKEFVLATIHRQENTDDEERLKKIIETLNELSNTGNPVVMPIHPRTRAIIEQNNLSIEFKVIDPVGYLEMVYLLENCKYVVTDSGGLQKEAYFFEKRCFTYRDSTEWTELLKMGVNTLLNFEDSNMVQTINKEMETSNTFVAGVYGTGNTSEMILRNLLASNH